MAAKDERIVLRLAAEQKDDFEKGAALDDMSLSSWFRWLAEQRREEQRGRRPQLDFEAQPALPAPEPDGFVPGF